MTNAGGGPDTARPQPTDTDPSQPTDDGPGRLAIAYLLAARAADDEALAEVDERLRRLRGGELARALPDDPARLAFWIDVYNGAVIRQPDVRLESWPQRLASFRRTVVTVAGRPLSLDAIEHGILRRSAWRLGLGYLRNPLPSRFEGAQRVERVDPRIHFALNCGAASCPPIAAYEAARIDAQLDRATRAYLAAHVEVEAGVVRVPRVLLWYAGDFGGPRGIRRLLRAHGVEAPGRRLRFAPYDWTPARGSWLTGRDDDPSGR